MSQFDIAIIGSGLVGSSFVRAISGLGLKVVVIDKTAEATLYSKESDNRGLALSYITKQFLEELKCWEYIAPKAYPIQTVHVSEQKCFGFSKLEAKKFNIDALGYVVSASDLAAGLLTGLDSLSGTTVLRPAIINNMFFDPSSYTWSLSVQGQIITAKLVVAADGSNSMLHSLGNIPMVKNLDMQQSAVVTNIKTTVSDFTIAYERFTKNGVLALLPFGPSRAKCVFTGATEYVNTLVNCSNLDFVSKIQEIIGYRLGVLQDVTERKMFTISSCYADKIYSDAMVLLGNAANTLHPVAAQGFNLGLRDAMVFAKVLQQAIQSNKEINNLDVLKQYSDLRLKDHFKTREFTSKLVSVFSDDRFYVKYFRHLGILTSQFIPLLNRKIMMQGAGVCR